MTKQRKEMSQTSSKHTTKKQPTAIERKQYMKNIERQNQQKQRFAEAQQAFKQVRDVTKTVRQTSISSYSKENVIKYLQNIDSYEDELRGLSRYLFYRSQVYFRLVMYNATMFDLNARYVVPIYDPTQDNDKEAILKSYYETLQVLEKMDLQNQMLSPLINNFIEDVFFGCCWLDDTGIFILKIPPEYCRISGKYFTGDYSFSVDMSKYKKYEDILKFLGDPLESMYKAYGGDSKNKWQPMPDEYALCTKSRVESWETVVPIYSGLFIDLIGLLNLADVQAVADEQQIYKLITATIPTISGADESDAWAVNIDLAVDYYNKMVESLPDYVGAAITPIPLDTISFSDDQSTDTTKVQKATKEVLNTSGGSQILNSASISGAEAFRSATRADTEFAISALLGQIQGWTNRMLSYQLSNPAKVKFFEVSAYTKDAFKESLQKDLQYDSSKLLTINALNGISELDTLSLSFLSNDILDLPNRLKPLVSANTVSNTNESGGQEKSDTELTDSGSETKDKEKNNN
jgi:hypothetical protein